MMNKKGFSFIEIMIVIFIFSLIGGGVFQIFSLGQKVYMTESALLDLQSYSRNAMDRMVREIRAASSVTVTNVSSDVDSITFTTPTATGVQYYLSGDQIIREFPSGTTRIVAHDVALLKFTLTGSVLQIELRADQTVLGRAFSFSVKEKVRLRNG
jgi:prepilin-type N-terminal cleavage/methylation domain-containing protein